MTFSRKKLLEYDFLRVMAMSFIVISHFGGYVQLDLTKSIFLTFSPYFAVFGMYIFIFLSGFLLYLNNPVVSSWAACKNFYQKRVMRIFPLYWLALALSVVFYAVLVRMLNPELYASWYAPFYTLPNIVVHAIGAEIILAPVFANPIPVLNFIGLILAYYLIYPLLVMRQSRTRDVLVNAAVILLLFVAARLAFGIIDNRFFIYYIVFVLGVVFGQAKFFERESPSGIVIVTPILLVFSVIADLRLRPLVDNVLLELTVTAIAGLTLAMVLFWLSSRYAGVWSSLQRRLFTKLAGISYEVFLFHTFVFFTFEAAIIMLGLEGLVAEAIIFSSFVVVYLVAEGIALLFRPVRRAYEGLK